MGEDRPMQETATARRGLANAKNGPRETVQSVLEEQGGAISDLFQIIESFEHRLSPILTPIPGEDGLKEPSVEPESIVIKISDRTKAIRTASRRLGTMVERLEI